MVDGSANRISHREGNEASEIIQSLHQDLQVAHQSKVSLQEALVEANKQGMILYTHRL